MMVLIMAVNTLLIILMNALAMVVKLIVVLAEEDQLKEHLCNYQALIHQFVLLEAADGDQSKNEAYKGK